MALSVNKSELVQPLEGPSRSFAIPSETDVGRFAELMSADVPVESIEQPAVDEDVAQQRASSRRQWRMSLIRGLQNRLISPD